MLHFLTVAGLLVVCSSEELGYHARIGVPTAARIKQQEANASIISTRIIAGYPSLVGEHPFFAGLLIDLPDYAQSMCGSSLLNNNKVLTAGYCYYDGHNEAQSILVVLGSTTLFTGGVRVYASTVVLHPAFNPSSGNGDLAILTIPVVPYDYNIKPIQLPSGSLLDNNFAGYSAQVMGIGRTSTSSINSINQILRDQYVTVISNAECKSKYSGIVDTIMCTSGKIGDKFVGPCGGDMGGPLILCSFPAAGGADLLIGVMSFADRECEKGNPAGYARITSHISWILSNI